MFKNRIFTILFFYLIITSCNNEININAPYKETTIVYGLLNVSDSVQYIKINKAFLSEQSVFEVAKIKDSLYHPYKIEVILTQVLNGVVLDRLALDTVNVKREEGTFAGPNQLVYRTKSGYKLNPLSECFLEIKRFDKNEVIAKGKTNVIGKFLLTNPPSQIAFYQSPDYITVPLNWVNPNGAVSYTIETYFKYIEVNKVTKEEVLKTIKWINVQGYRPTIAQASFGINALAFYNAINSQVKPNPDVIRKVEPELEFRMYVASTSFDEFLRLNNQSFGFNTTINNYSNVEGAVGVFSSRLTNSFFISLNNASIEQLIDGPITGNLGFQKKF